MATHATTLPNGEISGGHDGMQWSGIPIGFANLHFYRGGLELAASFWRFFVPFFSSVSLTMPLSARLVVCRSHFEIAYLCVLAHVGTFSPHWRSVPDKLNFCRTHGSLRITPA